MGVKRSGEFPEYPEWSNSRFWSFIRSALRRAWTRWPPKYKALEAASLPYKGKDKRRKKSYRCEICKKTFPQKQVQVDHKNESGSLKDYSDLPGFVERLFVSEDKLRVLCINCHKKVTHE